MTRFFTTAALIALLFLLAAHVGASIDPAPSLSTSGGSLTTRDASRHISRMTRRPGIRLAESCLYLRCSNSAECDADAGCDDTTFCDCNSTECQCR